MLFPQLKLLILEQILSSKGMQLLIMQSSNGGAPCTPVLTWKELEVVIFVLIRRTVSKTKYQLLLLGPEENWCHRVSLQLSSIWFSYHLDRQARYANQGHNNPIGRTSCWFWSAPVGSVEQLGVRRILKIGHLWTFLVCTSRGWWGSVALHNKSLLLREKDADTSSSPACLSLHGIS